MINKYWIIIDLNTGSPLYGAKKKTMMFTSKEVALELAIQLFNKDEGFLVFNTKTIRD